MNRSSKGIVSGGKIETKEQKNEKTKRKKKNQRKTASGNGWNFDDGKGLEKEERKERKERNYFTNKKGLSC